MQGILVLHMEALRGCLNMKIFVDTDDDLRLARRCAAAAAASVASAEVDVTCNRMPYPLNAAVGTRQCACCKICKSSASGGCYTGCGSL